MSKGILPEPPEINPNLWAECRRNSDFRPIAFEWYKFVGQLCSTIARFRLDSPIIKEISSIHYAILTGLLNRCSRLMLSNIALSHEGKFGETTTIIDRCIFETTIKIQWLIKKNSEEAFKKYLAKGLNTEVILKRNIQSIIDKRGGKILEIEKRMIRSADRHIKISEITEAEIESNRNNLPDLASMIDNLELHEFMYIAGQRIGSHHVHGNWSSLLFHYLEEDEEHGLRPRGHDCEPHIDQYLFISILVVESLDKFTSYIINEAEDGGFTQIFEGIRKELSNIYSEVIGTDFE